jgi:hypothetical protein
MSRFEIELSSDKDICVELICLECGSRFSTELDLNFKGKSVPYSNNDVLYCLDCEVPYDYKLKFDENKLEITFEDNDIFGNLKYSENVRLEEYKTSSILKSKQFYYIQIERLKKILHINNEEYIIDQSLNKLVYTGVITSLETYLNEIFTMIVFESKSTLENFVLEYEPYKKEKISFHEIFTKFNSLEMRVRDDLDNFIYHNIPKLIGLFKIFHFELEKFEKIKDLSQHIKMRHNLIHRSGIDKNDNFQEVTKKDVELLIVDTNSFVEYIHDKIEKKCYLPNFDIDFPF